LNRLTLWTVINWRQWQQILCHRCQTGSDRSILSASLKC